METASIITLILAAWLFGYVVGIEHGAEEERQKGNRK